MESVRATSQLLFSLLFIFFLLSPISAKTPVADSPAVAPSAPVPPKTKSTPAPTVPPKSTVPESSGPPNIITILQKAGSQFTTFIKLLRSTLVANQINTQLAGRTQGLTVFAPTDSAFSALGSGALNALSSEQQLHLIQYHVLPAVYTLSQFETITNPVHTQAGNSENGQYPLNITSTGSTVNITTGVVNATVTNTVYTDDQFSVYQVDKVLLPLDIFGRKSTPVAPAPAPLKPQKAVEDAEAPAKTTEVPPPPPSGAIGMKHHGFVAVILAMGVLKALLL
ncbi:fasciclin-like arabinogalactan protein 11 [Ziziphus jujuba]|uniref:Fasciclin-like arabinogalactan protein 11 n=1 Tax=Ziziphus jujuba TaxID=326968 RepID=A0A6P4ANR3_ZIZJJ|nr:fasciclin-like arabinogalactan protein 11 [Ziziphus jujuba]